MYEVEIDPETRRGEVPATPDRVRRGIQAAHSPS